jgi:hypothetical protein
MKYFKDNQKGQGLLELIIAIGVITTGLFSVWTLTLSNFSGEQESSYRVVGSNLAREGIEVVKNIRDSNWLKIENNEQCGLALCAWDNGLKDLVVDSGSIQTAIVNNYIDVDYPQLDFTSDSISDAGARLFIDIASGLYTNNSAGGSSPFSRLITMQEICCPDVDHDSKCDSVTFSQCGADLTDKLNIAIDVESQVRWSVNGKQREIIVEDVLYNWK